MALSLRTLLLRAARPLGLAPYRLDGRDPQKRQWRLSWSWAAYSALLLASAFAPLSKPAPSQYQPTPKGLVRTAKGVLANISVHLFKATNLAWVLCTCAQQHRRLLALLKTTHLDLGGAGVSWGCLLPAAGAALLHGYLGVPSILQAVDQRDSSALAYQVALIVMGLSKTMMFVVFSTITCDVWKGITWVTVELSRLKGVVLSLPTSQLPLPDDGPQLSAIRRRYSDLKSVLRVALRSFGGVLLAEVLMHVWLSTTSSYVAFVDLMHGRADGDVLEHVTKSFGALLILSYTVWVADLVHTENYEILKLTHTLRNTNSLSATANAEMEAFANQLHESLMSVNVCGILKLSKKHLFEMVAGGLAYLIIVLQFYP